MLVGLLGAGDTVLTRRGLGAGAAAALDEASAYRVAFTPKAHQWETHQFTWAQFKAVRRGTLLFSAPPLDPHTIHQLGFLIADRTAGPFRLEVASIASHSQG